MNRKSYLRGIGAGMIVTAIIMGIASGNGQMTDAEILRRASEIQSNESVTLLEHDKNNTASAEAPETQPYVSAETTETESSAVETTVTDKDENQTSLTTGSETTDKSESVEDKNTESNDNTTASVEEKDDQKPETTKPSEDDNNEGNDNKEEKPSSEVNEPEKINPMPEGETGFVNNSGSVEISVIRGDSSVSVSRRMFEAGLVESAAEFDKYLCANGYDKKISVGTYEIAYGLEFEDMAKIITKSR